MPTSHEPREGTRFSPVRLRSKPELTRLNERRRRIRRTCGAKGDAVGSGHETTRMDRRREKTGKRGVLYDPVHSGLFVSGCPVPREGVEPSRPGFVDPAPQAVGRGKQFSVQESNLSTGLRKPSTAAIGRRVRGVGLEPTASRSRTVRSTKLSYTLFSREDRSRTCVLVLPRHAATPPGPLPDVDFTPRSTLRTPHSQESRQLELNQFLRVFNAALLPS
jgi:hypothetical protein